MKNNLLPRGGVYELYWKFAYERQKIFEARRRGEPGPWTLDPILAAYKFCNAYRALDRETQYLIREICYGQESTAPADKIFQIVAFRFFSRGDTWDRLRSYLGRSPIIDDLVDGSFRRAIENAMADGPIYTHAFILCAADSYGQGRKYLNHIELFRDMFIDHDFAEFVLSAQSLRSIYDELHSFPLIGNFMAYQIAIDLNYSDLIDFSENEFTVPGPGSLRGIRKVFVDIGDMSPAEVVMWMVDHQGEEFRRLGYEFSGLFGRELTAIDCQNLFCETDKYCRVAVPELASARSQIKAKFNASAKSIDLFLPPKWQLDIGSALTI